MYFKSFKQCLARGIWDPQEIAEAINDTRDTHTEKNRQSTMLAETNGNTVEVLGSRVGTSASDRKKL